MKHPTQYAVQREYQRYVFSQPLLLRKSSSNDVLRVPGTCMEISEGGISAILTEPLKIGEQIELSFELISGQRIYVKAVVRNQSQFRYGFEFLGLSDDQRLEIQRACSYLSPYEGGWY